MDPRIQSWRRLTFIEPIIFFIMLSFTLSDSVITDVIVYKTCRKLFGENDNCTILYKNSSSEAAKLLQNIIQPHIATLIILKSSIETLIPMILCLFMGPWSDKNGRRPLLTIPFIGSIIYYVLYSTFSNFSLDPYWFLLPSIISSIMGGFPAILLMSFCYIADTTGTQNRACRLGFLDFILFGGQLVGFLVGPVLFKQFGYCVVFATSALSCTFGFLYSYFCVKETIYSGLGRSIKTIFDLNLIKNIFKTVTQKRDGFDRCLIWCCLIIIALHDDMMQGTATILYLFTKRFGWSIFDFSIYSVVHLSITMIGMMLLVKIIAPLLKLSEPVCIIVASISNSGNSLTRAFALKSWHLYFSTAIGIFTLAPASLVRSIISKIISQQDIGKGYSITMIMEKIGPFVTTPLFVFLHTNFIKMYPCPVWILTAILSMCIIILSIILELRWRNLKSYFLKPEPIK